MSTTTVVSGTIGRALRHPSAFHAGKRIPCGGLFGRSLLIIVMPLILLQLISATVFYERHWDNVARRLASMLAGDIGTVIDSFLETQSPEGRERVKVVEREDMLRASEPDKA